jgi:DNA-binding transcriptional regulator YdaS (Cro superfamily)
MKDLVALAREAKTIAVQKAGGGAALARLLNISRSAITHWDLIPPDRVADVASATGIPAAELRPDLAKLFVPVQPARAPEQAPA